MKYVNTTDESIGGMLHDDGKLSIVTLIDGLEKVEIIEDLEKVKDIIDTALPIATAILKALINAFSSIVNPFPVIITQNDEDFRFTEQRAPFSGIDRVFYMSEQDKENIIYLHEDKRMPRAKRELRLQLKELGYIK